MSSRNVQRRRKGKSALKRSAPTRNGQPRRPDLSKLPPSAVGFVCGMLDPFCEHSLTAKVPSSGSFRSVTANIADFTNHSVLVDATTADNYICCRYGAGLNNAFVPAGVMNNSVVTVATRSDSGYQATLAVDAAQYRVVACGVRFRYTGAPISASGFFRIFKVAPGGAMAAINNHYPNKVGDLTGLYWDYTPAELAKGVTVFLNRVVPQAKDFGGMTNEMTGYFEGCAIFGVGLDTDAQMTSELRQTLELQPIAGTTSSLLGTPNHPESSAISHATSHVASQITAPITGPSHVVGAEVAKHASNGIWSAIKQFGSSALDALPGLMAQGAGWAVENLLPMIGEGLAGAAMLL